MSRIMKALKSPVIGADGTPVVLDNGKPCTLWGAIWRAAFGTVTVLLGIKAFFLAFAIAAVLDGV